jgi:predicted dehydrogenase
MPEALTRRAFVAGVSAASAARVLGANDRVRLGIIGSGSRGRYLMRAANKCGGIQWVAVCDAWDQRQAEGEEAAGMSVAKYGDYRRVLERNDIDGVIIATFDHLHAPIAAEACRAGKDVYVEKPMTSVPMQGHGLVKAVRETNRILQVGVQQRSMTVFQEAKERFFDTGMIGRVHMVRTIWNANRGYLSPAPAGTETKPEGLDWGACLTGLPAREWDARRYFNRFAYWDFSTGGQTGGLFVHMVDVAHWYLNLQRPDRAAGMGGIYQHDDGRDTPDNVNLLLTYPQRVNVSFEASITDLVAKESAQIVFMGSEGRLTIFRGGYRFVPVDRGAPEITAPGSPEDAHMANWLECMRSRKEPNANAVDGHYSSMACHIGNIAYQEKRLVEWQKEWDV